MFGVIIRHTNVLTNIPDDSLGLLDLNERFIYERDTTESENRRIRILISVLFAATVVGTLALCHTAVAVMSAELMLVAFVVGCIACMYLNSQWQALAIHERRLQKGIFEELLLADEATLEGKLEVFHNFGADCKELQIPDPVLLNGSSKHVRLGTTTGNFLSWARDAIGEAPSDASILENLKFNLMHSVLASIEHGFLSDDLRAWDSDNNNGFPVLIHGISSCRDIINGIVISSESETSGEGDEVQAHMETLQPNIGAIMQHNGKIDPNCIVWDVNQLAEILGCCTNLTNLFINKNFECSNLFEKINQSHSDISQMKLRTCESYAMRRIWRLITINSLQSVHVQFNNVFRDKIVLHTRRPRSATQQPLGSPHVTRLRSNSRSSSPSRTPRTPSQSSSAPPKTPRILANRDPWRNSVEPGWFKHPLPDQDVNHRPPSHSPHSDMPIVILEEEVEGAQEE